MITKKNYFMIFLLCANPLVYADTIALGIKGGFDFSFEHAIQRTNEESIHWGMSSALGGSAVVYSDIFWGKHVSFTPEFAMHFMRGSSGLMQTTTLANIETDVFYDGVAWASHEYSLGVMLKLYAGWFYGGIGFAATYSTAPRFIEGKNLITAEVGGGNDAVDFLNNQPRKGMWGYNSTLELGLDIPAGPGRVNISSRTTLNFMNLQRYLNFASNSNPALRSGSLFRTGLFVGYSYNLR